ncbi:MAG: hypothetical protein ACI9J3_001267 [Parvicellaceae bacterium]|jgi:hypothetical protein
MLILQTKTILMMRILSFILFIMILGSLNAQTVNYNITATELPASDCPLCFCGDPTSLTWTSTALSFTWTSTGIATPISVHVEIYESWNDAEITVGTPVDITLNAVSEATYSSINTCNGPLIGSITLTPANYNFGALNTFNFNYFPGAGTAVEWQENLSWGSGVVARVVVTYPLPPTAPVAGNDVDTVFAQSTINVVDIQANDSDANLDTMTTSIISGPTSGGTVTIIGGDSINYEPPLNFCGVDTVEYSVCDPGGLCDTAFLYIFVLDQINPTAICQNVSAYVDGGGNVTLLTAEIDNGSSDNCSSILMSLDTSVFTCASIGSIIPVLLTVTDNSGNIGTCSSNVTVVDTIAPVFTGCPVDISVDATDSVCSANATWSAPTVADNCSSGTLTSSHNSGDNFDLGVTTVTYYTTDLAGNQDSCMFTVTVTSTMSLAVIVTDEILGAANGSIDLTVTGNVGSQLYDWDNDGTGDYDDLEDLSALLAGTYTVVVADSIGCMDTTVVIINNITGLSSQEIESINMYPNPTNGEFFVELNKIETTSVEVLNLLGERIEFIQSPMGRIRLMLNAQPVGFYIVRIRTVDQTINKVITIK